MEADTKPGATETPESFDTVECPECHQTVKAQYAIKHARSHWADYIEPYPAHQEAIKRQKFLYDVGAAYRNSHPEGVK